VRWRARIARVARLGPRDWLAVADGAAAAVQIELRLWTAALGQAIEWAESRPPRRAAIHDRDAPRLQAFSVWPYRAFGLSPSCLRRSLVLTALLRQRGRPATLCVGVRKDGHGLRAHAWVECGPARFDTSADPFDRLQPAAALNRNVRWHP
jgi:hypothetical protein